MLRRESPHAHVQPAAAAVLTLALAIAGTLASAASSVLAGTVYDLTADWSDTANPNGVWCYREGTNALPHVSAWQGLAGDFTSAQPAWARFDVGTSNLPCFFRSSASVGIAHDWQTGDVVCHTTDDFNGLGSGTANVTWTSPVTGIVAVSGAVWMGRDIGRGNHWSVALDGATLTSGDIASGDAYDRASPLDFAAGSGGPAALTALSVRVGDVVELDLTRTSAPGDYAGIRMQVQLVTPADAPGAEGRLRLDAPTTVPVRGATSLRYALPREGRVRLAVYDLHGRQLGVLEDAVRAAGEHVVAWPARVPDGVYFLSLRTRDGEVTRRTVVCR